MWQRQTIFFWRNRWSIGSCWGINRDPKMGGHHRGTSLPCPSMGVTPSPGAIIHIHSCTIVLYTNSSITHIHLTITHIHDHTTHNHEHTTQTHHPTTKTHGPTIWLHGSTTHTHNLASQYITHHGHFYTVWSHKYTYIYAFHSVVYRCKYCDLTSFRISKHG